ncbi:MAG: hypothetical protein WCQ90_09460 [Deltaproteobacteria bacterium]
MAVFRLKKYCADVLDTIEVADIPLMHAVLHIDMAMYLTTTYSINIACRITL